MHTMMILWEKLNSEVYKRFFVSKKGKCQFWPTFLPRCSLVPKKLVKSILIYFFNMRAVVRSEFFFNWQSTRISIMEFKKIALQFALNNTRFIAVGWLVHSIRSISLFACKPIHPTSLYPVVSFYFLGLHEIL